MHALGVGALGHRWALDVAVSDAPAETFDRGVDVDQIANEIRALHEIAEAYGKARAAGQPEVAAGLGADLERAAVRYADKRAELIAAASRINYVAIVEAAKRERDRSGN
jgi:hypothetical protein